jgi:hypothetical protein
MFVLRAIESLDLVGEIFDFFVEGGLDSFDGMEAMIASESLKKGDLQAFRSKGERRSIGTERRISINAGWVELGGMKRNGDHCFMPEGGEDIMEEIVRKAVDT